MGEEGGPQRNQANQEAAPGHMTRVPRALTNPRVEDGAPLSTVPR